ncbi:transcriptional regulator, partial [Streptomyces iconiensis]
MGWWQVNADTLASSRFVISPLAETIASLKVLQRGTATHPGERAWLGTHLGAYRRRLARDPLAAHILRAALRPRWNADYLTPPPEFEGEADFAHEVASVRETPPEAARRDLVVALEERLPALLERDDLPERTADTLEWVWRETVLPSWPRRRRVLEADVVARTAQLSQGGWAAALDDMRPGMRWLGDSRLQINSRDYPPRELAGARLMFVPVTPWQSWVAWDTGLPGAATPAVPEVSGAAGGGVGGAPDGGAGAEAGAVGEGVGDVRARAGVGGEARVGVAGGDAVVYAAGSAAVTQAVAGARAGGGGGAGG